jgi:cbb3-type cytochrome oxidase subunit 3
MRLTKALIIGTVLLLVGLIVFTWAYITGNTYVDFVDILGTIFILVGFLVLFVFVFRKKAREQRAFEYMTPKEVTGWTENLSAL